MSDQTTQTDQLPAAMLDAFVPLQRDGFDPVPALGALRATGTVTKLEFPFGISAWLVTGYQDVRSVLVSDEYSNDFARLEQAADAKLAADVTATHPGGLGFADPPDHTRLRKLLTPEFTMRRLARLQPLIEQIVNDRLDALEDHGPPADLVELFAMPIPSLVICELLGVPYEERGDFERLSQTRFDIFANLTDPLGAISESLEFLRGLVQRLRREPNDGLLGALIRDHGDVIDDDELAGLADGLFTGGHETTASMIALGSLVLIRRPDVAATLRASDEHTAAIVEELLRYLSVVQVAFPRFAKHEVTIAGQRIARGDLVLLSLSGADRDPALNPVPDSINAEHASTAHLAFGHGIHRCVGAELARMELRVAFPALVRRFPQLRAAVPDDQIAFRPYSIVHGVDTLPVNWLE